MTIKVLNFNIKLQKLWILKKSPLFGKNSASNIFNIGPEKRLKPFDHIFKGDLNIFFKHNIRFLLYHVVMFEISPSVLNFDVNFFVTHFDNLLIILK